MSDMNEETHMPDDALREAMLIQRDAASLGFDWPDISGVLDKVDEEIAEIRDALAKNDWDQARSELGDLLFSAVNLSRFLETDPGLALSKTNARFRSRFESVKQEARRKGLNMQTCSLRELDVLWDEVKSQERQALEKRG
jgi:uncharacterized protein YabN with tetrapyrrole methylase and pyrophosphatase domain